MKSKLLMLIVPGLLLVGCGEKSGTAPAATNAPANGGSVLTAPVEHLKSAVNAKQNMVKTVDTTALNKAIDMFQVQEGRLPNDLDELVAKKYIPEIPLPPAGSKIVYNATKGVVTVEKL